MDLPDVSKVAPIPIEDNAIRTPMMEVTFINEYGRYEPCYAYWHDVMKCFYRPDGSVITNEIARTDVI